MYKILIFLAVLVSVAIAQTPTIIGGVEATPGEFPFMVSLQSSGRHFCGGSLINPKWVLTAAHCVGSSAIQVKIGLHGLKDADGVEVFNVKRKVVHPNYNKVPYDSDYALLELDGESQYASIEIKTDEVPFDAEFEVVTSGWGVTREGSYAVASKLQKVTVPLVSQSRCESSYPGKITETMICAGLELGGKDSCQGDSGGPLFFDDKGEMVLVGVVSWGEGCARPKKYGVYSRISNAVGWINDTISAQ